MGLTYPNLNLLSSCRWLAYLPVQAIDSTMKSSNISFNLTSFDVNALSIASNDVGYLGYQVAVPAGVRDNDKTMTFNYMPDSSLSQYRFLYKWFSKIVSPDGSGAGWDSDTSSVASVMVPVRVVILSEFKNQVVELTFENSWISELGTLSFNYQDPEAAPITHNFTIKYERMSIEVK